MESFRLLFNHFAWIEHEFLSGIRDSMKPGSLWGIMRGVGGVRKSIHQSWLAKGLELGLRLLCWGFEGVQEEIPSKEASTLQIGSVAFPPVQCTSPQLHPCHRLSDYLPIRKKSGHLFNDPHIYISDWKLSRWKCHWPDLKSAGLFRWNLFLNSLKTST